MSRRKRRRSDMPFQLGRWFSDRLRRVKSRFIGTREKLRPEWEMDNFFCSHRCLLAEVMVVRGASVFQAPARPASSLVLLADVFLSETWLFPIMLGFMFLDLLHLFVGPHANTNA
jgi:hypothetical protein